MSAAIYISTETPLAEIDEIAVNGKYFILHIDNISAIGEEHGLKRLDEYIGYTLDETLEFMVDSSDLHDSIRENHEEDWFDPKEGYSLIKKYIDLVKSYHSLSDTSKKHCLEDLESYKKILEVLTKHNIRWHFSCDI